MKKKIDRYWIEESLYRLLKALVLVSILMLFNYGYGFSQSSESPVIMLFAAVLLQFLALVKIPSREMKPLSYKRTGVAAAAVIEIKFVFTLTALVFFAGWVIDQVMFSYLLGVNFACQMILFAIWRAYNLYFLQPQNMKSPAGSEKTVLIVGASNRAKNAADVFLSHPDLNVRVLGFLDFHRKGYWRYRDIPLVGRTESIEKYISQNHVDFVIMAAEPEDHAQSQRVFTTIEKMGVNICLLPHVYRQTISKCQTSSLNGTPVLMYNATSQSQAGIFLKDTLDRIGGLCGLILSTPVLLLAAIAIKIDSSGPVFFKQKRSGKNGRLFDMFKLRTMSCDAEKKKGKLMHLNEMSGPVFKIKNDPRVTKVGRILRKLSLDEFPQFYNVLKGDMSLVGPRPPLPKEVEKYKSWQHRKLSVKPGLTCIWQVSGRNNVDFDNWMKQDLEYIDNWSLKKDAELIIKTIPAVLKSRGAC